MPNGKSLIWPVRYSLKQTDSVGQWNIDLGINFGRKITLGQNYSHLKLEQEYAH